mmetsp:Transcript_20338/g.28580  ORF Transcript_20338/g.28580 Transcript_20338/m.28580 type:complete len:227 (-) Transcript_20338:133-813(-)
MASRKSAWTTPRDITAGDTTAFSGTSSNDGYMESQHRSRKIKDEIEDDDEYSDDDDSMERWRAKRALLEDKIVKVQHAEINPRVFLKEMVDKGKVKKAWSSASCLPNDVKNASVYVDQMLSHANDMKQINKKLRTFKTPKYTFNRGRGVSKICNAIRSTPEPNLVDMLPKETQKVLRMALSPDMRKLMDEQQAKKKVMRKKASRTKKLPPSTFGTRNLIGRRGIRR